MKTLKTFLTVIIALVCSAISFAQSDEAPWLQNINVENNTKFTAMAMDVDDNVYLAGNIDQGSLIMDAQNRVCGVNTSVIIKINNEGSVEWNHCYSSGDISDIAYREGSIYFTGTSNNGFIVKRVNADTGVEVTNANGVAAILSVNDTGTVGANGYGIDIIVRDGYVYFGGMITGAGFNVKREGSASGAGELPSNLSPRGVDDFYIGRIDTTFDLSQLKMIQAGHANIAEISDKFEVIPNGTNVSARFETHEATFVFDSTNYSKSVNNDFESLIYTFDFDTETIYPTNVRTNEITHLVARPNTSLTGFVWLEKTSANQYTLYRGENAGVFASRAITSSMSADFTITGFVGAADSNTDFYTMFGYTDASNAVFSSINFYPANSTNGRTNLYAIIFTNTTLNVGDIENLGEVDGSRASDLYAFDDSQGTRYAYAGSLDLNTDLLLGAQNVDAGSANYFVGSFSPKYFKFLYPENGMVLKQYEVDTLHFQFEDVAVSSNIAINNVVISDDNFATTTTVQTSNTNPISRFKREWDKPDTFQGTYQMAYPNQDTISFSIEAAGLLTSSQGSINFGNQYMHRTLRDTVVFTNNGTASTTIDSVKMINGTDFSILRAPAGVIGIAQKDTLVVEYQVTSTGHSIDTVQINHTGAYGQINFIVQGTGLNVISEAKFAADSNATPITNAFNPFIGADSTQVNKADTVTTYIVSVGTDSLNIDSVSFASGAAFRLESPPITPLSLLPTPENDLADRLLRLDIIFEPTEFKNYKDTIFVQTNSIGFENGRIEIPLLAIAKDTLGRLEALSPIVFNSVLSENDTADVFISLKNTGLDDLIISSVSFSDDYFELGQSISSDNSVNPLVTTEVAKGQTIGVALQTRPNFYDLPNDTTLFETMTIHHSGSGGKSTFDVEVNLEKTEPVIQFKQVFTSGVDANYPSGYVNTQYDGVPIQEYRTEVIEFYNKGTDTLTINGVVSYKQLDHQIIQDDRVTLMVSINKDILAPGDTGIVNIDYELFEFLDFGIGIELFTDAVSVLYQVSRYSSVTEAPIEEDKFGFTYFGTGVVPTLNVQMSEILTDTIHPSFVNVLFQATDPYGVGVTFLNRANPDELIGGEPKPNFFTLKEGTSVIAPGDAESDFQILKQDAIDFEINTALVLDKSASIGFANLPLIKEAAIDLVRNIEEDQRIGIYTFSSEVQTIQTFTSDTTQLINAINSIQLSGSSTNLFGSVVTSAGDLDVLINSTLDKITRGNIVVFTDGKENTSQYSIQEVQAAITNIDVYAVGVGDAEQEELQQITGFSGRVFQADDPTGLASEFRKIQREIAKVANSFYWINYISPKRFGTVDISVSVDNNRYSGTSNVLNTSFVAEGFSDVSAQVVVNQNFPEIFGIDTLYVPANGDTILTAVTILNDVQPNYKWESSNESKAVVHTSNQTGSTAELFASGVDGDQITITVTDTSNIDLQGVNLSKDILVILGPEQAIPDHKLDIVAAQTGTFELGNSGLSIEITSNTGDGFSITTSVAENPGTNYPNGVESIYQDIYWIITLESAGTPEFQYDLSVDVSGFTIDVPEKITLLKRIDSSSSWTDLSEAGLSVSIANNTLLVTGLTDFNEYAVAVRSESISTERVSDTPNTFLLSQNYPNPFNPSTTINFALPNATDVRLELFNTLGQKVMTIVDGRYNAGWHSVMVDASSLSSGMYIYRIVTPEFNTTRKMMLLK